MSDEDVTLKGNGCMNNRGDHHRNGHGGHHSSSANSNGVNGAALGAMSSMMNGQMAGGGSSLCSTRDRISYRNYGRLEKNHK